MSDLFEGLFDLVGEAAGAVAEIAVEGAGALFEGTTTVASAVAEGAGPALAGVARGVGHVAGAAARGVASASGDGLVSTVVDVLGEAADVDVLDTGASSEGKVVQPARSKAKGGRSRRARKERRRLKSGGEASREALHDAG
jgi:hypothetical protein